MFLYDKLLYTYIFQSIFNNFILKSEFLVTCVFFYDNKLELIATSIFNTDKWKPLDWILIKV